MLWRWWRRRVLYVVKRSSSLSDSASCSASVRVTAWLTGTAFMSPCVLSCVVFGNRSTRLQSYLVHLPRFHSTTADVTVLVLNTALHCSHVCTNGFSNVLGVAWTVLSTVVGLISAHSTANFHLYFVPFSRFCKVLHFQSWIFSPAFSGPVFSAPANWSFIFRSSIFSVTSNICWSDYQFTSHPVFSLAKYRRRPSSEQDDAAVLDELTTLLEHLTFERSRHWPRRLFGVAQELIRGLTMMSEEDDRRLERRYWQASSLRVLAFCVIVGVVQSTRSRLSMSALQFVRPCVSPIFVLRICSKLSCENLTQVLYSLLGFPAVGDITAFEIAE